MEVMVGSSFGIGMAACVRDRTGVSAQDKTVPAAALFSADESGRGGSQIGLASRIGLRMNRKSPEESSEDSSSSIGECSENEEEEEDDAERIIKPLRREIEIFWELNGTDDEHQRKRS
ncbi:Uncharacterized protein Rs2_16881 [Raphanus sativus]|nr:Uncharacterized protein Rs2_16881 [Raphanus sativus]